MTSLVAVVDIPSDPDDTAAAAAFPPALHKRSHAALTATSPDSLEGCSPSLSKRRPPASPIVLEDTPTPPKRLPSVAPNQPVSAVAETRQSIVPCSLGSRAAVAETPNFVLPCSSRFRAADSEIPGSAVSCSIGSDIVVAETPGFTSPRKLSGVSCPISLDSDDDLDDTGYREQLPSNTAKSEPVIRPGTSFSSDKVVSLISTNQKGYLKSPGPQTTLSAHKNGGTTNFEKTLHADLPCENSTLRDTDVFNEKHSLQEENKRKKEETARLIEERKKKQQVWLSKHVKEQTWLKSLIAIPKVQPRHALAIWKKYRSMRSLLNVYMDPNKTVREKNFCVKT